MAIEGRGEGALFGLLALCIPREAGPPVSHNQLSLAVLFLCFLLLNIRLSNIVPWLRFHSD